MLKTLIHNWLGLTKPKEPTMQTEKQIETPAPVVFDQPLDKGHPKYNLPKLRAEIKEVEAQIRECKQHTRAPHVPGVTGYKQSLLLDRKMRATTLYMVRAEIHGRMHCKRLRNFKGVIEEVTREAQQERAFPHMVDYEKSPTKAV